MDSDRSLTCFSPDDGHVPAFVIAIHHPPTGLRAFIVLDDLTLGPAAGGVRTRAYRSVDEAVGDARRLAAAMTEKCALGGVRAGGGKAVVLDHPGLARAAAFEELGRRVEALGGLFRTAGDLGTTEQDLEAMHRTTRYVHLDEASLAASVARGLLRCVETCAALRPSERGGRGPVSGLRVAVQGCGAIGGAVARELARAGATLVVADTEPARAAQLAREIQAEVVDPARILSEPCDVLAPCAIGGVITEETASAIRAWAVCGAANNILASPAAGRALHQAGVLFVPDVISSAGAAVDGIGRTVMGLSDRTALVDALGDTAREVLLRAERTGTPPAEIASAMARERIAAGPATTPRDASA